MILIIVDDLLQVLNKLPVAQHFLFGEIFQASWVVSSEEERSLHLQAGPMGVSMGMMQASHRSPAPGMGTTVFRNLHTRGHRDASSATTSISHPMVEEAEIEANSGTLSHAPWAATNHSV